MNNRFWLVILAALFIFSCDHFVNLGDKSAGDDYTEGLPDEISEDSSDSAYDDGNRNDWNEDYEDYADTDMDSGVGDGADYAGDTGADDSAEFNDYDPDAADANAPYDDGDASQSDPEWDEDSSYVFPESNPFPAGFSNAECGCGDTPDYQPVCCNSRISVFNSCFANCYAVNSGNKICYYYETGLCSEHGITKDLTDNDTDTDSDLEFSDNDADTDSGLELTDDDDETGDSDFSTDDETDEDIEFSDENVENSDSEFSDGDSDEIMNECGCYPENETAIFRCGSSHYLITKCLATCHCDNPEKLSF